MATRVNTSSLSRLEREALGGIVKEEEEDKGESDCTNRLVSFPLRKESAATAAAAADAADDESARSGAEPDPRGAAGQRGDGGKRARSLCLSQARERKRSTRKESEQGEESALDRRRAVRDDNHFFLFPVLRPVARCCCCCCCFCCFFCCRSLIPF